MGTVTSTSTLAAGASRAFNLAPGSAVSLTLLPNCRVTVTETPAVVAASPVGGNAPRTHNLRYNGVFTYGPYAMGGVIVVTNETNSGSVVTWTRTDSLIAEDVSGAVSVVLGDRNINIGTSIVGVSKIRKMLAAIGQASFRRVNLGYQSHSVGAGVNATNAGSFTATEFAAWGARSMGAIIAKRLAAAAGGVACSANIAVGGTSSTWNPLITVGGGAANPLQDGFFGPATWNVVLASPTQTMQVTAVGTSIRVYCVNSGAGSVVPGRWSAPSVSGGAVQTAVAPGAGNNTPAGDRTFNEWTIGPVVAGETVTIYGPSSGSYRVYYLDMDYQPSVAGVTVHRLCSPGAQLVYINAAALDSTDTQGPQSASLIGSAAARVNARLGQAQSVSVRVPQDGVILMTDVNDLNDWASYGYTLADLQRHLSNYLAYQASLGIPVLVLLGPIRDPAYLPGTRPYDQDDLIAAYKTTIDAATTAAYIDLTAEFTGATLTARFDAQQAAGLMADIYAHPGAAGHAYWGTSVANALLAAAANR